MPALLCNRCDSITAFPQPLSACPACSGPLVPVQPTQDVIVCPKCDYFAAGEISSNEARTRRCPRCARRLRRIQTRTEAPPPEEKPLSQSQGPVAQSDIGLIIAYGVALGLALDGFLALVAAAIFSPEAGHHLQSEALIGSVVFLIAAWFILKSSLAEMRNAPVRTNHAIEHATIAILEERSHDMWWGLATEEGFHVAGAVRRADIETASREAIERLRGPHPDLRVHPCCGGRFFIDFLLVLFTSVAGPALLVAGFLKPVVWAFLLVIPMLWALRPALTRGLQRFMTTAVPPPEARIVSIVRHETAFFVRTVL